MIGTKEKLNNTIGLSSLLVHVCVKLETKYIYTIKLVAGVTGYVFTAMNELFSISCGTYIGGEVSTAAYLDPTPDPTMQAKGSRISPCFNLIPCSTPATTKI